MRFAAFFWKKVSPTTIHLKEKQLSPIISDCEGGLEPNEDEMAYTANYDEAL